MTGYHGLQTKIKQENYLLDLEIQWKVRKT